MRKLPTGSIVTEKLPNGCELCQRGMKLVLFITGLCPRRCFYCPLSNDRKYVDVIFANEKKVSELHEIIDEALLMDAQGTGVTGGEPLLVLDRTIKAIKLLKSKLGKDHHIHLYTTGFKVTTSSLKKLEDSGLDEIRFHVCDGDLSSLRLAVKELKINVGVEIPMLPDKVKETMELLKTIDKIKVDFVNLNELEFTESNALSLLERGYELRNNSLTAAKGSREAALEVLSWAEENTSLNVHFCPVTVKDSFQTRLRLFRRALNVANHYELVTDEGTIVIAKLVTRDPMCIEEVVRLLKSNGLFKIVRESEILFRADYLDLVLEKIRDKDVNITINEYLPTLKRLLVHEERII